MMKLTICCLVFATTAGAMSACSVEPSCPSHATCETTASSDNGAVRTVSQAVRAEGSLITKAATPGSFTLFGGGQAAPLIVSPQDHRGVVRAAGDLQQDILKVSGTEPTLTEADTATGQAAVLIGTVGNSPLIDGLVAAGKVDLSALEDKWETFVIQAVEQPMAGVDQALVIAGSDKRGTIFGIYELSNEMGMSPWHYWADVPPLQRAELNVAPGVHSLGEPAIKYRGLFINDENPALYDWYQEAFGSNSRGFESDFYVRLFELTLRLKGNYLWPAMWGKSFNTDDVDNPRLADEYGVVMGTSHHEPLTRAEQEWYDAGEAEDGWSYAANAATLEEFWRGGIERMGERESLVTLGMRGSGDKPNPDQGIPLLESVVSAQRQIIQDVTGKDPSEVPQVWTLYKEVQGYYDNGMQVPEDVTLMFADDNWGNIRRLPSPNDAPRSGGYGVYYHYDYVGGPRSYRWLNTNPIPKVWEQMSRAYHLGADKIWIVNVGDLKPMEFPLHFFMDLAWDPDSWTPARLADYPRRWARAQFGSTHAEEIGELISTYSKFNGRRKPELLSAATYSVENFREADTVVNEYNALVDRAEAVEAQLADNLKDAYFQLVLHPILACANLNEMYVSQAKNDLYAAQGRASTNEMAARVNALYDNDTTISERYHTINGGKWNHMMKQTHIGYTTWDNPATQVRPPTQTINPGAAGLGVAIEGSRQALSPQSVSTMLPELSIFYPDEDRRIEVFNRGTGSFEFTATSDASYVTITPSSGTIGDDTALSIEVDWAQVPEGDSVASITIDGEGGNIALQLPLVNPASPQAATVVGFVEANGYISLDASHYTDKVEQAGVGWAQIPNLGRTGSAVHIMPSSADSVAPGDDTPQLHYKMHFAEPGALQVRVYLSPSLPVHGSNYRYAVSFDESPPQMVDIHEGLPGDFNDSAPIWEGWVSDNTIVKTTNLTPDTAGEHTLKLWMVDTGVVVQKIVVSRGTLPTSYLGPPARLPLNFPVEQVTPDRGAPDEPIPGAGGSGTLGAGGTVDSSAGGTASDGAGSAFATGAASGNTGGLGQGPGTDPNAGGSTASGGGVGATVGGTGGDPAQGFVDDVVTDDGCSCSTTGRRGPAPFAPTGAFLLLAATCLRRRRWN